MSDRTKFWVKLIAFMLFTCIVPFLAINYYYDLFNVEGRFMMGGWSMILIVLVSIPIFYALSRIVKALEQGLVKQIIVGVMYVIVPLVIVLFMTSVIAENVMKIQRILYIVIPSVAIGIVVNPLPVWVAEREQSQIERAMQIAFAKKPKAKK